MGKMAGKVIKKMDPFHRSLRNYSRGAISIVCLQFHCPGVAILFFPMPLVGKLRNLKHEMCVKNSPT
jgi:hypothetical protein